MQRPTGSTRGSHPILQTPFSGTHYPRIVTGITSNYNSAIPIACPKASVGNADFRMLLILVHSPLLKESQLVSVPPLTYMLKFSGSSRLTSCLGVFAAWLQVLHRPHATTPRHRFEWTRWVHSIQRLRTRLPHGCRFGHKDITPNEEEMNLTGRGSRH